MLADAGGDADVAESGRRPWPDPHPPDRWASPGRSAPRAEGETSSDDQAAVLVVPIRIGTIIRALEKQAAGGSSQAARELRSWLAEYPPADTTLDPATLSEERQQRILVRLNAEIEAEEAAKQAKTDGNET
jgi:hypothetical protein